MLAANASVIINTLVCRFTSFSRTTNRSASWLTEQLTNGELRRISLSGVLKARALSACISLLSASSDIVVDVGCRSLWLFTCRRRRMQSYVMCQFSALSGRSWPTGWNRPAAPFSVSGSVESFGLVFFALQSAVGRSGWGFL